MSHYGTSRCPRGLSAASQNSFSMPRVAPFLVFALAVFFGGMIPIPNTSDLNLLQPMVQAYSQISLCASAKAFQAARRSGRHARLNGELEPFARSAYPKRLGRARPRRSIGMCDFRFNSPRPNDGQIASQRRVIPGLRFDVPISSTDPCRVPQRFHVTPLKFDTS